MLLGMLPSFFGCLVLADNSFRVENVVVLAVMICEGRVRIWLGVSKVGMEDC